MIGKAGDTHLEVPLGQTVNQGRSVGHGFGHDVDAEPVPCLYHLRCLELEPSPRPDHLSVSQGGDASGDRFLPGDLTATLDQTVQTDPDICENGSDRASTISCDGSRYGTEILAANDDTPVRIQDDRNTSDILRYDDDVVIGHVAVLFTDLKGSSALYRQIGDAPAYRLVRKHFAFLAQIVREYNGTVVKTIGDAVMATFVQTDQAVKAAFAIQCRVNAFNHENGLSEGVVIKLAIHAGPTIAVNLCDRVDYFGSSVNIAAQLRNQSMGGDLILSDEIAANPSVARLLLGATVTRDQAALKGFDQPQKFHRVDFAAWVD